MKLLSSEVRNLLDKLYNLRGEDSYILKKMEQERNEAIETQERTKNEKTVLLEEIEQLNKEEQNLAEEGNKLISVLSSIKKEDFSTVLTKLNITFDPEEINDQLSKSLPETIDKVVAANKEAQAKLENVETEMNNAITKAEELDIRKDEALSNQRRLNEIFDLALNGNINITRDEITNLLEKFNFDAEEQREAAKILMFPEDALYEYETSYKNSEKTGKTIAEVLVEAKQEYEQEHKEEKEAVKEDIKNNEEIKDSAKESKLPNIFDKVIEENIVTTDISDMYEENSEEEKTEEVKEEVPEKSVVEQLDETLNEVGMLKSDFLTDNYNKLLENYDKDLLISNVSLLKEKNIDIQIAKDNVELLYDRELKDKINKLLEIGKESIDISLTPSVLVKYSLQGLNNTINVLQISGLDPKKVPLMAY